MEDSISDILQDLDSKTAEEITNDYHYSSQSDYAPETSRFSAHEIGISTSDYTKNIWPVKPKAEFDMNSHLDEFGRLKTYRT